MRITIKEIAKQAGVSIGTVDRVLHNRGEVAEKTKQMVLAVAKAGNYATNVYARNLKLNKSFTLAVIIPLDNEYWQTQRKGMEMAAANYAALGLNLHFFSFDRRDRDSFEEQSKAAIETTPDGVIMVPLLMSASENICEQLKGYSIPYVFVDSNLEQADPLTFIGQSSKQSGYLAAKMLNYGFSGGSPAIVVKYSDYDSLNKTIDERIAGFKKYYEDHNWSLALVKEIDIEKDGHIDDFLSIDNEVSLFLFVPNSRAHQLVKRLNDIGYSGTRRVIGYDKISKNLFDLKDNKIDFIINQNPYQQGLLAVESFYKHLIINVSVDKVQYMPLELVTKENVMNSDVLG